MWGVIGIIFGSLNTWHARNPTIAISEAMGVMMAFYYCLHYSLEYKGNN